MSANISLETGEVNKAVRRGYALDAKGKFIEPHLVCVTRTNDGGEVGHPTDNTPKAT